MNTSEIVDQRTHPVDRALSKAMDGIHADYERVMRERTVNGYFDPMLLPKGRVCIPASNSDV